LADAAPGADPQAAAKSIGPVILAAIATVPRRQRQN
jgi:hypothetical protein